MRTQRFNTIEQGEECGDTHDHSHATAMPSKLERRRRIEDLDEEKRLREELNEY